MMTALKRLLRCVLNVTKLLKLKGVGTLNAINLYIALCCADLGVFQKGKGTG